MKKILLLFFAGLLLLGSCKTKELEYLGFENPRVVKMSLPTSTVALDVTCYNPNRFGLRITELNSDVFVNNEYLGKAFIDSAYQVPRLDTFLIPVKMDVKMGPSITGLMKLLNDNSDTLKLLIKLDGKARVRKGGMSFTYPIHYEELKAVKF